MACRVKKNNILKNLTGLYSIELINPLINFFLLLYLVRVLSLEIYGVYVVSVAAAQSVFLLMAFGFNMYAAPLIVRHQQNYLYIQHLLNSIIIWRILMTVVCVLLMLLLMLFTDTFNQHPALHLINFLGTVGQAFFAIYYFQAIGQLQQIALLFVVSRVIFSLLIGVLVAGDGDLYLLAWLSAFSYMLPTVVSLIWIYRREGFRFASVPFDIFWQHVKGSAEFFWSRIFTTVYAASTTVIAGLLLGFSAAGLFAAVERLIRSAQSLYMPLNQVLYPYMAQRRDLKKFVQVFLGLSCVNALGAVIAIALAPWLLPWLLGEKYSEAVPLFQLGCLSLIVALPAVLLGYPLFGPLQMNRVVNQSAFLAVALYALGVLFTYSFFSLSILMLLIFMTESVVLCYRLYYAVFVVKLFTKHTRLE